MASRDPLYQTAEWRALKEFVFRRDGYRCTYPECGRLGRQVGGLVTISAAHRVPARDRPDLALDPNNVRTLCLFHHGKEDGGRRYGRQMWRHG